MKNTLLLCLAIVLVDTWAHAQGGDVSAKLGYPQMIIYNAKLVTMDDASFESKVGTVAQAMAIRDGKILATGSNATIQALAGPQTKSIDLKGRTVLPSFFMTHEHPTDWAFQEPRAITHVLSNDDVIIHRWLPGIPYKEQVATLDSVLRKAVSTAKPGQWIFISFNWGRDYEWTFDTMQTFFQESVKKEYLDQLAPNNPVKIKDGFVSGTVNQKAMEEFRSVHPEVPQQFAKTGYGFFERTLEPDVMFKDNPSLHAQVLKAELELWASYGVTTFASSPYAFGNLRSLRYLDQRGELPVRFAWSYTGPSWDMETLRYIASVLGTGTDYLWNVGAFAGGGSNCMSVPTRPEAKELDNADTLAKCNNAPGTPAREQLDRAIKSGLRLATIHTGGDKDIDYYMDSIEQASKDAGITLDEIRAKRHTFDHSGGAPRPDQIQRMKKLGMMASLNNFLLWGYDGNLAMRGTSLVARINGTEYAGWVSPRKGMTEAGVMSSFEIDRPLPHKLFFFVTKGMNRYNDRDRKAYGPNERTDRIIQLKALTRWGAYYVLREKLQGTLEPGKFADFIVLDKDYLTIPEDQIPNIQVLMTVVGGKVIHLTSSLGTQIGMQPIGPTTWNEPLPPGW